MEDIAPSPTVSPCPPSSIDAYSALLEAADPIRTPYSGELSNIDSLLRDVDSHFTDTYVEAAARMHFICGMSMLGSDSDLTRSATRICVRQASRHKGWLSCVG